MSTARQPAMDKQQLLRRPGDLADEIEDAIQAGCGTLKALEASLASVERVTDHERAERALREALELVRVAISDLETKLPGRGDSVFGHGFITRAGASQR
jgi:hypothetical protein